MERLHFAALGGLLLFAAGGALAQEGVPPSAPPLTALTPIITDRPGITFSSLTVGDGVGQAEFGLPSLTLIDADGVETRSAGASALVRYGLGDEFELRLGAPLYTATRHSAGSTHVTDRGYGDLEVGAKWHLLGHEGGRPSLALIPAVILPTGEDGFSAGDPVYQLNAMAEWAIAGGWGLGALAGALNGPAGDGRYHQETFALAAGRALPAPAWSAYGEFAYVSTALDGAADSAFLGAGLKYLVGPAFQLDASFDRGLTDDSPDWLLGLGLAARF